ncbi:MAG: hypothetical protein E6008_10740, partial [Streptococcus parasanguinis]|nr:hypothetical protein [Streptococcus parasanguinis]MDU5829019.1 hypothetical protein [Mixta calida]
GRKPITAQRWDKSLKDGAQAPSGRVSLLREVMIIQAGREVFALIHVTIIRCACICIVSIFVLTVRTGFGAFLARPMICHAV